jgi:biopolymer transport protein ExbD
MAGGGSSRSTGGKKRARIEIIPLIDVIFFLLATFVLFTLSLQKSNGLPVGSLPNSETGEPRDPNGTATVSVLVDGSVGWNKEPITLDEFIKRLEVFHSEHPEPDAHIIINGDENANFSAAVYVLDEARKAGIGKVLIDTHLKPKSSK